MTDKPTSSSQNSASSIWGGRFAGGPSQLMLDINTSISYDKALFRQDIAGSCAHATMLQAAGILSADDLTAITTGLAQIETEIAEGTLPSPKH